MVNFSENDIRKLKDFFHMKETPEEREKFLMHRAFQYAKILQYIPGILLLGVGNSVAMNTAHKDSDIDLFIITENKRLWLVRIICTLLLSLLGVRKTKKHHKDRFCLSFFVTEKSLDFSYFALKNDIYLYFWILSMKPIIDTNNIYKAFLEANSKWIPLHEYSDIIEKNKEYLKLGRLKKRRPLLLLDFVDSFLKRIFLPRSLQSYYSLGKPYGVIINDNMLKFHDKDKRKEIREMVFGEME